MSVGVPGNVPYVITVGAMSDAFTPAAGDDYLATFSAAGPTADAIVKPDLVAPGGHVLGLMEGCGVSSSDTIGEPSWAAPERRPTRHGPCRLPDDVTQPRAAALAIPRAVTGNPRLRRLGAGSLLLALAALLPADLGAQTPNISFDRITTEHGLPQSTVSSMLQDRQGFLWLGTQGGLARYDGYRFTVYKHDRRADSLQAGRLLGISRMAVSPFGHRPDPDLAALFQAVLAKPRPREVPRGGDERLPLEADRPPQAPHLRPPGGAPRAVCGGEDAGRV